MHTPSLDEHLGPQSQYSIAVGKNASPAQVRQIVNKHVETTVNGHQISTAMEKRFTWLADGDSQTAQKLFNHFLMQDRRDGVELTNRVVEMLLPQVQLANGMTHFERELRLGRHQLHIHYDPLREGVEIYHGRPVRKTPPDRSWIGCLGVIVAIVIVLLLLSK